METVGREVSIFNFGEASAPIESVSREVSLFNFGQPSATIEAISREQSIFNFGEPSAINEAISREVSILNFGDPGPAEAISREVSIFNFGTASATTEAISREVSVFNFGIDPSDGTYEAISREVSIFNIPPPSAAVEAISREVSVFNALDVVIVEQPASKFVEAGAVLSFTVTAAGTPPLYYQWHYNGTNILNATNSSYIIVNAQPGHSGVYGVLVSNAFSHAVSSNAVLSVSPPDTTGPTLSSPTYGGVPVVDGLVVSNSAPFTISAMDPSGVSRVDFYIGNVLTGSDTDVQDGFSSIWNVEAFADGPYVISFRAYDTRNNFTVLSNTIVFSFAPPVGRPFITSPANGAVVGSSFITVQGLALPNTSINLYINGSPVGTPTPVSVQGRFQSAVVLNGGTNMIEAAMTNRAGEGSRSSPVHVLLDTSKPAPPNGLQATGKSGGGIQLQWLPVSDSIRGYNLYRATNSFAGTNEAAKMNVAPLTAVTFNDTPPNDGKFFYRVSSVNNLGTEGDLSTEVSALADGTPPSAMSVIYNAYTNYDAIGKRFGQSLVDVTITVNEPLLTTPFFSLTPSGGQPIAVSLRSGNSNQYLGTFAITASTPSGVANALFSARDVVGNRGTTITNGNQILIDATGPVVTNLALQPSAPIRNDSNSPVIVTFTAELNEPVQSNTVPQFGWILSSSSPAATPITASPGANSRSWTGSFTLPPTAGATPETLTLTYAGEDDLRNASSLISIAHNFEVYQENLPPLEVPLGLSAKSLPNGAIQLTWQPVPNAVDYQLYRQGPGDSSLNPLARTGNVVAWTNTPAVDGTYLYAVASVRRANSQEAVSAWGNVVYVQSDRVLPTAPQNLLLTRANNGIFVQWSASSDSSGPVSYRLYRASSGPISQLSGLGPLLTNIPIAQVVDTTPSPLEPYYAVAAVDGAGNLSLPSNTGYLNTSLLPPHTVTVSQTDINPPIISWTAVPGTIAGYNLFLGTDGSGLKLNTDPLTATTYSDAGYGGEDRLYTVVALDQNQQESDGHTLLLPSISAALTTNAVVKRGLMNLLTFAVQNSSLNAVSNAQVKAVLAGRSHSSASFDVAGGATTNISLVVGGYTNLTAPSAPLTVATEIRSGGNDLVSISRSAEVAVDTGQLIIGVMASEIVRGGNARVHFSLLNPGDAEIEVLTATSGGAGDSSDIRFTLLDVDGNVLSTVPFRATIGSNIVNLANGNAVMRLHSGDEALSPVVSLPVPASAPDQVFVRVEIDKVYYHSDRPDAVIMDGIQTRASFPVVHTSYTGTVTNVTPSISLGDQPIVISGHAQFRAGGGLAPYLPLVVKIFNGGFLRTLNVLTDGDGNFSTSFQPLATEAGGTYYVCAVHPDLNDQSPQGSFVIKRVLVTPAAFTVRAPYNIPQPVTLSVVAGPDATVTNLHVAFQAEDQPGGSLPLGVSVDLGDAIPLLNGGPSGSITLSFTGTEEAATDGTLVLRVRSDDAGAQAWQRVDVTYQFSQPNPHLQWTPSYVDTGVAPSNSVTETITLQNNGFAAATNLHLSLTNLTGAPLPPWAAVASQTNVSLLSVGESLSIGLLFSPDDNAAEGDYQFALRVASHNAPTVYVPIHVAVASSGLGNALFKVVDMFSAGDGTNFFNGVSNAVVFVQNALVPSIETNAQTDELGEVFFEDLPAGQYNFQVSSPNHSSYNGVIWVRPGATGSQLVPLLYNLVTVTWSVVETTIQDSYNLVLDATFETSVPAAVLIMSPGAVNLPQMSVGDVYFGEFSIRNHGLIRAEELQFQLPASDAYFDYELLAAVPDQLAAGQTITVPYRMTCKQSFPGPASPTAAPLRSPLVRASSDPSSSACFTYSTPVQVRASSLCLNGLRFPCGASSTYYYSYTRDCPGASGGIPSFGGGGPSDGGVVYTPGGTPLAGPQCFPHNHCGPVGECDNKCGAQGEPAGSWVGLISRQYEDQIEDLKIKVPGGHLNVVRQFYTNQWHWIDFARRLTIDQDLTEISSVRRHLVSYFAANAKRTLFRYRENRIHKQDSGFLWENKDGDWEKYDVDGTLLSSGKRNVTLANYIYDGSGSLVGVNDRDNRRIFTYQYLNGRIHTITDLTGRRVTYHWTGDRLTRVVDVNGEETSQAYNAAGQMIQKTDVNGHIVNITYDNGGYVHSVLDAQGNGKFFQFNYDVNSRQYYAQVRTTAGHVKEVRFDGAGEVVYKANNGIRETEVLRDARTELTTHVNGTVTRRDYDEFGNALREIKPDGGLTQYSYDSLHQPVQIIDPRGAVTRMRYDNNGNLVEKIEAFGTSLARTNSWIYNADNQPLRHTDARGHSMDSVYDTNGNLIREFDAANPRYQNTYEYDARGNRIAVTNALGFATLYDFDAQNRLVAETNSLGHVSLYTYDGKDLVQVETGRVGINVGRIMRYRYDGHHRRTHSIRVDTNGVEHVWQTTTYDPDGRVIAVANALGQTTRFEYNALGQRTKISAPFTATETSDTTFSFDEFGRLHHQTDPLGGMTQYEYDIMDRQRLTTEALGTDVQRTRERFYDLNGNLVQITYSDATNTVSTFYDYDLLNRRIAIRGAREYPKQFQYDANDNLIAETNARGYATIYAYDQYNRRTNIVEGVGHGEPGEHAGSLEYDLVGNVITTFGGNRNCRHFRYDALNRQIDESISLAPTNTLPGWPTWWLNTNSVLIHSSYNPWNEITAITNWAGGTTHTAYDAFGRRIRHTDAAGLTLTYDYSAADQLLAVHYPVVSSAPAGSSATALRYTYSPFNPRLLISSTDRANRTTLSVFDKRFQRTVEVTPWGATNRFGYDLLRRQVAFTNAVGDVTRQIFDSFDQLVATIHPDHVPGVKERIEHRAYDDYGKVTNQWGAATYPVSYGYDAIGNQTSLTDGNGNTTRWEFDGRNRKTAKVYADNTRHEYTYDAANNLVSRKDAMNRVTRYSYDANNQLTFTDYPTDADVTFGYNPLGWRLAMVDGTGTNAWTYDSSGRVISNAQMNTGYILAYGYNAEGSRTSLTLTESSSGSARRTDYSHDRVGRLSTIDDSILGAFYYDWDSGGRVKSLTAPNGVVSLNLYDHAGRKLGVLSTNAAGHELYRSIYEYDAASQRVAEETPFGTNRYSYNERRELVSAERQEGFGATGIYGYNYDPIGNWLFSTTTNFQGTSMIRATVLSFQASSVNQYETLTHSSSPGTSTLPFTYDLNGNLTSGPLRGGEYAGDLSVLRYNEEDRMVFVSNTTHLVTSVYDGFARRVKRIVSEGNVVQTNAFVYDNWNPIAEINGERTNQNLWGLDVSQTLENAGGVGGLLGFFDPMVGAQIAVFDGNGNVTRLASLQTGEESSRYRYSPFGKELEAIGSAAEANRYRFSTKYLEIETKLSHFGFRFYTTSIGRWLSRDPIEEHGGLNLYAILANDTMNEVDALGLAPNPCQWAPQVGNCRRFALNDPPLPWEPPRSHPSGWPYAPPGQDQRGSISCPNLMQEIASRGGEQNGCGECPSGSYRVHVFYADCIPLEGRCVADFHYVVEAGGGYYGKRGLTPPDGQSSELDKYYVPCGSVCVPNSGINAD